MRADSNMQQFNILSVFLLLFIVVIYFFPSEALEFKYHNNKELENVMKNFTKVTKNIYTNLYQIGTSFKKKTPLWVMELSGMKKKKLGVPNIKFVANIHGNEAVGRELLLHFMEYLRDNYGKNDKVKCLLDNTRIHLLPSMNPNGFDIAIDGQCEGELGRENFKDREDLNRNFPDYYHENRKPLMPETKAVMKWMEDVPFILSAGLHGGAMVANYPFDTIKTERTSIKTSSVTPDNDVFEHLARVYAENHPKMRDSRCENGTIQKNFQNGTINGAAWYPFAGGMQDYNYFARGCMEITLEISCCKYPKYTELPSLWEQNKEALLMFSLEALRGIAGQVLDSNTKKPIANAKIQIVGRNMSLITTKDGEFWRILLPGNYELKVQANGYHTQYQLFVVTNPNTKCPRPDKLIISLTNNTLPLPPKPKRIRHRKTTKSVLESTTRSVQSRDPKYLPLEVRYQENTGNSRKDPREARIINKESTVSPLTSNKNAKDLLLLLDVNEIFQTPNMTENDIRELLHNELNITDLSSFEDYLKQFDGKTDNEKNETLNNITTILQNVAIVYTTEEILRSHMKTAGVTNFEPYEDILKNFDKQDIEDKKKALSQLLIIFLQLEQSGSSMRIHYEFTTIMFICIGTVLFNK